MKPNIKILRDAVRERERVHRKKTTARLTPKKKTKLFQPITNFNYVCLATLEHVTCIRYISINSYYTDCVPLFKPIIQSGKKKKKTGGNK